MANWVSGVNGVSAQLRPRVAQVLGLEEAQLTLAVDSIGRRSRHTATPLGPAQRAVALVQTAVHNGELLPARGAGHRCVYRSAPAATAT